jgi:hypothetical protein
MCQSLGLALLANLILFLSAPTLATDIFFICDNNKSYSIDENTLAAHLDQKGELAVKLKNKKTYGIATGSQEDPIYLGVTGRYFGTYVLALLKTGKIEFPTLADAENTLVICEQLGLPKAENYIKNYIESRSFHKFTNEGFSALALLFLQKKDDVLQDIAQLVINATVANDASTLRRIYEEKVIDINFLIPCRRLHIDVARLNGSYGSPTLSYAAEAGNLEAAQLLLDFNADPNIRSIYKNMRGKNALQWAKKGKNKKVIRLIEEAMKAQQALSKANGCDTRDHGILRYLVSWRKK